MVKFVMTALFFALLATNSYAGDLSDAVLSTQMSNNVEGVYLSNGTGAGATDATAYIVSTGHVQGNKNYASGSFESKVYVRDNAADDLKFASTDLFKTATYDSSAFTAFDAM